MYMSAQKYDSYNMFMKKLNSVDIRTLTKEEEYEMLKEIKSNPENKDLVEKFINHNLRMVVKAVVKYKKLHYDCGMEIPDLINEGYFGLKRAIEKFDLNKGYKFSTYAMFWIKQTITMSVEQKKNIIRKPIHFIQLMNLIKKIQSDFCINKGRMATNEEISDILRSYGYNYSASKVKEMLLLEYEIDLTSLDKPVEDDLIVQGYIYEFIPEKDENTNPENYAIKACMKDSIEKALTCLKPKEKEVIILRYGLQGEKRHTLEEIGKKLDLTRERIRQIEEKALSKLKNINELKGYSEDYETKENKVVMSLINKEDITKMYFTSGSSYLDFYKNHQDKINKELKRFFEEEEYRVFLETLDTLIENTTNRKTMIRSKK